MDIPHDWLIYDVRNLYEDSTGWYRKVVPGENLGYGSGKRAYLRFDGVYMDNTLYVNGQKVGDWKYGYSAFGFVIGEYVREGENELLMQVRFLSPNSRWYSGAGIYRNVWLKLCPPVYLPLDGTYVSAAREEEGGYRLEIDTECDGTVTEDTCCHYTLWDGDRLVEGLGWHQKKRVVWQKKQNRNITVFHLTAKVTDVKVWDITSPACYCLQVELFERMSESITGGKPVDTQSITVGFRQMEFRPDVGFI